MKKIILITLILILFSGNALAWYEDYEHRIPLEIDNTGHLALTDYQFNISIPAGINETSIRVVNETLGTTVPHWCENETSGLCYELWFNTSIGSEVNTDYYIYYGNDSATSTSDYDNVFTKKYNDSGLVLELHMDEGTGTQANDTSGEGNHGTMHNMAAPDGWQGTDGGQWGGRDDMVFADGDKLRFDGTNDMIRIPDSDSLTPTSAMTAMVWVKGAAQYFIPILSHYDYGVSQKSFAIITSSISPSNKLEIILVGDEAGNLKKAYESSIVAFDNTWHLMGFTFDAGTLKLYIDGVEDTNPNKMEDAVITAIYNSTADVMIGCLLNSDTPTRFFNGSIDDVRIYNRALSGDEIYRQYIRSKYAVDAPVVTMADPYVNISLYSSSPSTIYTNYTGIITASYMVESNFPLNYSSLAFLMGVNHTPTSDMHAYLKPPANDIADGIYRAHNRNNTPYLSWEYNATITEDNVWKWAGGDNDSFWIAKLGINDTHTWINITGIASNVFPSMFYIDRAAMYSAPKTGFEINRQQGIIIKTWDLEQLRGRSNDYYISMWFDTMLESTAPTENLEIWYCNDSFNPLTDDPVLTCDRKDSWTGSRWIDHESWQPHNNVSYCKPLVISADIATCSCPPTEINYIYITSETVTSKSYILNATNYDPGITNITYAQTETMWLYNELSGVSTPLSYTPSFYITFIRDYVEYLHHLYISNNQDVWGHSDINNISIGIADVPPTHTIFNYFWWDNTTDYNMNNSYEESFWVNLTYGYDPDNGAALTHVLSLYDDDYNFIAFINSSLTGNQTDEDVFFDITDYRSANRKFKLKIVSTDNEGSTSGVYSKTFELPADNRFYKTIGILEGFPIVLTNTLSTFLSYLPLFVGILIAGSLILLTVGIFSKFKRW